MRLTSEAKQDGPCSVHDSGQGLGIPKSCLQVDLLPPTSREHAAELEPDEHTGHGNGKAENPYKEGCAYAASAGGDGRRGREDAGANDAPQAESGCQYKLHK